MSVPVTESSQVAEARRVATAIAERRGFGETDTGRLALVVTELATNLVKHASGGEVIVRFVEALGAIEVLALDRGPGMRDVGRCFADGYSTAGSHGIGLGAIVRQSVTFDVVSAPGVGTAILAIVAPKRAARATTPVLDVGVVSVPHTGETRCGDGWAVVDHDACASVLVVDGLGHGLGAATAADEAIAAFQAAGPLGPAEMMRRLHAALRPTRGAAIGIATVDTRASVVRFCGVGNVAAAIVLDGGQRNLVSHAGIVGHDARRISEFTYPWRADALLVVNTDGLTSRWDLLRHPSLVARHPSLIAGVMYRDFTRGRDDATVVVARQHAEAA